VELRQLEDHIRTLATVEEAESPLISCYLDLSNGVIGCRDELDARFQVLRRSLPVRASAEFDESAGRIEAYLNGSISQRTRGLAVFVRAGAAPFWLALQFEVPLPNWIAVGSTPNIYHLVELKDNYDRYVILLTTEASARIIGVNLGSVTAQLWRSRPELRRRVGHEWTKEHFQDHRRERTKQFIHDQIRSLDQVISAGGYGHLMLAGNARMISAVRKELPKRLAEKLVDAVPAGPTDHVSDIVASTLQPFLEHEELESQAFAERLITQIRTHGLAVAGTHATVEALKAGQADLLVLVKSYDPGQGWECRGCGRTEYELPPPNTCPECRTGLPRTFDIKGELVRLAEQQQVGVEVVEHNDVLMALGGVGCLLRYLAPVNYSYSAA
jgi:rubrerythrin